MIIMKIGLISFTAHKCIHNESLLSSSDNTCPRQCGTVVMPDSIVLTLVGLRKKNSIRIGMNIVLYFL